MSPRKLTARIKDQGTVSRQRAHPRSAPIFSLSSPKGGEGRGEEAQGFPAQIPPPRSGRERETAAVSRCAPRQLALLLFAVTLAGCSSIGFSYYSSPRVTGQVLAAESRQPLPDAIVRRVVSYPTDGEDTAPKGGQLLMRSDGVRTDADGRFALEAVKVVTLFRRGSWHSVTVSFERNGYESFETNYSAGNFKERSPEGVPLVNAGDILLKPISP